MTSYDPNGSCLDGLSKTIGQNGEVNVNNTMGTGQQASASVANKEIGTTLISTIFTLQDITSKGCIMVVGFAHCACRALG